MDIKMELNPISKQPWEALPDVNFGTNHPVFVLAKCLEFDQALLALGWRS